MNLKHFLAVLITVLQCASKGNAQGVHSICWPMQHRALQQAYMPTFSTIPISAREVQSYNLSMVSGNTGNSMRQVGKIMMIAGGVVYFIGGLTVATHGKGNVEAGTAIATTGAVVLATGIPIYFIGRSKMKRGE